MESQPLLGFTVAQVKDEHSDPRVFQLLHKGLLFYVFKADDAHSTQRSVMRVPRPRELPSPPLRRHFRSCHHLDDSSESSHPNREDLTCYSDNFKTGDGWSCSYCLSAWDPGGSALLRKADLQEQALSLREGRIPPCSCSVDQQDVKHLLANGSRC